MKCFARWQSIQIKKMPELSKISDIDTEQLIALTQPEVIQQKSASQWAALFKTVSTQTLVDAAHVVTERYAKREFNFCSVVNAKSGKCTEDCAWCSQSKYFQTNVPQYPLIDAQKALEHARVVEAAGIKRFSLVTSGRKLSLREVREVCQITRVLCQETGLEICLSAGLLTLKELQMLHEAGVRRCHCNLESSRAFFANLCTTHSVSDKIKTLKTAREVGMEVCSGGIIGLGESEEDRISLALQLAELNVPSIPINILNPIRGTRLENVTLISDEDIVRSVAIFRLFNRSAYLRFAGGRARLSEKTQRMCLKAGINSAISGDLLTTKGNTVTHDRLLAKEAGYLDERTH